MTGTAESYRVFVRKTATFDTGNGPFLVRIYSEAGGLAVTRIITDDGKPATKEGYAVTHMRSGWRAGPCVRTLAGAVAVRAQLLPLTTWTVAKTRIPRRVAAAVRRIFAAAAAV